MKALFLPTCHALLAPVIANFHPVVHHHVGFNARDLSPPAIIRKAPDRPVPKIELPSISLAETNVFDPPNRELFSKDTWKDAWKMYSSGELDGTVLMAREMSKIIQADPVEELQKLERVNEKGFDEVNEAWVSGAFADNKMFWESVIKVKDLLDEKGWLDGGKAKAIDLQLDSN